MQAVFNLLLVRASKFNYEKINKLRAQEATNILLVDLLDFFPLNCKYYFKK